MNETSSTDSNTAVTAGAGPSLPEGECLPQGPSQGDQATVQVTRRATGPRTDAGKAISSKNALKYGIFSKALVLPGAGWIPMETQENFDLLLNSYVDHYQPEGPVEMHQIELAVGALWRYRRLLHAEAGEIEEHKRRTEHLGEPGPDRVAIQHRRASIPSPRTSEGLQRYEAHLLRVHYRALAELERLQRMRFGDTIPAPLILDVQGS